MLVATFVAALTLELKFAIYIGVLMSLLLDLDRTSHPGLDDVKPFPRPVATSLECQNRPTQLPKTEDRAHQRLDIFWYGQPSAGGFAED